MSGNRHGEEPGGRDLEIGVRTTYDRVSGAYDEQLRDELSAKPLDRALLDALIEMVGDGTIADVGCGPGHVTRYLAHRHPDVVGIDLSPAMIDTARGHGPDISFIVGSMLDLPAAADEWAGAIALYSIIHLTPGQRLRAFGELARCVRTGGWLLVAFHLDSAEHAVGESHHLTTWFDQPVDIDAHFLDPDRVSRDIERSGFAVTATLVREPVPGAEYPSRRCSLLAQRRPAD